MNIVQSATLPAHLGGHEFETHTDEGALKYIKDKFDIKSMVDVGCGPGGMVRVAHNMGIDAYGVDGDYEVDRGDITPYVAIFDYSKGPVIPVNIFLDAPVNKEVYVGPLLYYPDLAWSVEFLEHVDARYVSNFMATFRECKYVICTHAFPGQVGHHHVNCRESNYWIDIFEAFGFVIDGDTTNAVRNASTMRADFMRQQSLFFRNLNQ